MDSPLQQHCQVEHCENFANVCRQLYPLVNITRSIQQPPVWSLEPPSTSQQIFILLTIESEESRDLGHEERTSSLVRRDQSTQPRHQHTVAVTRVANVAIQRYLPSPSHLFNFATFNTLFNSRAARHGAALLHLCCHSEGKMSLNFARYFSWKFGISEYSVTFRLFTRRTVAECWDIIYIFSRETERTANTAWPSPLSHVGNYIYRYLDISI